MNERSRPYVENQATLALKQFFSDNPVSSPGRLAFSDLINYVEARRNIQDNLIALIDAKGDESSIRLESKLRIAENIVAQLEVTRMVHEATIVGYRESEDTTLQVWTELMNSFPLEDDTVGNALETVHRLQESTS